MFEPVGDGGVCVGVGVVVLGDAAGIRASCLSETIELICEINPSYAEPTAKRTRE